MYKFNDIHAKKAVRTYILITILGILFLASMAIPITLGMRKVNEIYYNDVLYAQYNGMDRTTMFCKIATTEGTVLVFIWIFAILCLAFGIGGNLIMQHFIKKHGGQDFVETLELEISRPTTLWLPSSKVYLTEHYLISFKIAFCALKLKDVLWVYQKRTSINGIPSNVSLILLCSDGKKYEIANASVDAKDIETEAQFIAETVAAANPKVLIGFTNETKAAARKLKKEIKKQRKTA